MSALAQSGHGLVHCKCPLLGVKRTWRLRGLSRCGFEPLRCLVLSLGEAMRRRDFITLIGTSVAVWPLTTYAQQPGRMHRIGVLLPASANDSEYPTLVNAFVEGLQQLGWTEGRNIRIDIRWAGGSADTNRRFADELVALAPD